MASFLGLMVQCTLNDMKIVTGVVTSIDPVQGTITLSTNKAAKTLRRDQVASLEVVSSASSTSATAIQSPKQQQQQQREIDEDFDFGAGLSRFDKAREFEAIRQQDTIDPSLRLHAHNKRQQQPAQEKLKPSENVLDESEQLDQKVDVLTLLHRARDRQGPAVTNSTSRSTSNSTTSTQGKGRHSLPLVSAEQLEDVLSFADSESGPDSTTRLELGALNYAHHLAADADSSDAVMTMLLSTRDYERTWRSVFALRCATHLLNWSSFSSVTALIDHGASSSSLSSLSSSRRSSSSRIHSASGENGGAPAAGGGGGAPDSTMQQEQERLDAVHVAFKEAVRLFTDSKGSIVRRLSSSSTRTSEAAKIVIIVADVNLLNINQSNLLPPTTATTTTTTSGSEGGSTTKVVVFDERALAAVVPTDSTTTVLVEFGARLHAVNEDKKMKKRADEHVVVDLGLPRALWSRVMADSFAIERGAQSVLD